MAFKPGDPKPPNSGRRKGQPNKKSADARVRLENAGCDLDEALAKAILAKDYAMIEALSKILQYYQPKFKEIEPSSLSPVSTLPDTSDIDTEELLKDLDANTEEEANPN